MKSEDESTEDVNVLEMPGENELAGAMRAKLGKVAGGTTPPPIADQIGRHLRSMYEDVLAQPVPDRFLDLMAQLDDSGKDNKKDRR